MTLTPQQVVNVSRKATRPIILVRLGHSGTEELLSASGRITYDGEIYLPGVKVSDIKDGESATVVLPATAARVTETQNGTWRRGICQIIAIPATPEGPTTYAVEEAILRLDGVIAVSSYAGKTVTLQAIHRSLSGNRTPRNLISEFCNHLPAPGTVIEWNGTRITLEARR